MSELVPNNSDFILYTSQDGEVRVDVFVHNESVWLTQKAMQELFDRSKSTVSEHISNVFKEGELDESQVVRKFRTTADDGKDYEVSYYNLDVIISVGYRIKSQRGTQFRIWATKTLKEFIIKNWEIIDLAWVNEETFVLRVCDEQKEVRNSKPTYIKERFLKATID